MTESEHTPGPDIPAPETTGRFSGLLIMLGVVVVMIVCVCIAGGVAIGFSVRAASATNVPFVTQTPFFSSSAMPVATVSAAQSTAIPPGSTNIRYGDSVNGQITIFNDFQNWYFEGRAGDEITISMEATDSDLDPFLTLREETSTAPLMTDDDSGDNRDSLIEGFVLPSNGTYVIEAGNYSGTGDYILTLTSQSQTQLLATVSATEHPQGCDIASIDVTLADSDPFSAAELEQMALMLREVGTQRVIEADTLNNDARVSFALDDVDLDTAPAYLIQMTHPTFIASATLVQLSSDCSDNQVNVVYEARGGNVLVAEKILSDDLTLDWWVESWAAAPSGRTWAAVINLTAEGDSEPPVFWVNDDPQSDTQFIVSAPACQPARAAIGVTSGDEAVLSELVLESPFCP